MDSDIPLNSETHFHLPKDPNLSPRLAIWFAQMEEVRERLLKTAKPLDVSLLDFTPNETKIESIGTLLLHIAAVEWSWIFEDIDGMEMNFEQWKYAFAIRPSVNLPQLKGKPTLFYLDRLQKVRSEVYQRFLKMTDEDIDKIVGRDEKYTIEWILFHIIEHEVLHIGQINLLSRLGQLSA